MKTLNKLLAAASLVITSGGALAETGNCPVPVPDPAGLYCTLTLTASGFNGTFGNTVKEAGQFTDTYNYDVADLHFILSDITQTFNPDFPPPITFISADLNGKFLFDFRVQQAGEIVGELDLDALFSGVTGPYALTVRGCVGSYDAASGACTPVTGVSQGSYSGNINGFREQTVPEPQSLALTLTALAGVGFALARTRSRKSALS